MPNTKKSQVELVRLTMKSKISRAIKLLIENIPGIRYCEFDNVRILSSDFNDMLIPAVQLIDVGETIAHEHTRAKKSWNIRLELVMKENEHGMVSQEDLWNFTYKIERAMWETPNLGIQGVIQLVYIANTTDLHLVKPYYLSKLDFTVLYYEDLVSEC